MYICAKVKVKKQEILLQLSSTPEPVGYIWSVVKKRMKSTQTHPPIISHYYIIYYCELNSRGGTLKQCPERMSRRTFPLPKIDLDKPVCMVSNTWFAFPSSLFLEKPVQEASNTCTEMPNTRFKVRGYTGLQHRNVQRGSKFWSQMIQECPIKSLKQNVTDFFFPHDRVR